MVRHNADQGHQVARLLANESAHVEAFVGKLKAEFGDDDQLVSDMIEGSTNLHELLSTAALRVLELEAAQDGIKASVAKLRQRSERFERQITALREAMRGAMSSAEMKKLELPAATLSLAAAPRRLRVVDEAQIPEEFWVMKRELSKAKVADALKDGEPVPGAILDNGSDVIRILTN